MALLCDDSLVCYDISSLKLPMRVKSWARKVDEIREVKYKRRGAAPAGSVDSNCSYEKLYAAISYAKCAGGCIELRVQMHNKYK